MLGSFLTSEYLQDQIIHLEFSGLSSDIANFELKGDALNWVLTAVLRLTLPPWLYNLCRHKFPPEILLLAVHILPLLITSISTHFTKVKFCFWVSASKTWAKSVFTKRHRIGFWWWKGVQRLWESQVPGQTGGRCVITGRCWPSFILTRQWTWAIHLNTEID